MSKIGGLLVATVWLTVLAVPAQAVCPGDCDGNGSVTVDELIRGVNIALGNNATDQCPSMDTNADGAVTVDELVRAVNAALNGCPQEFPPAAARKISDPADLIGGPLALGRVGDYLMANDRIRVIIRDVGRDFSFGLTYGGNIIDADLARPEGEPGRDNFGSLAPLINISSTANVQQITVVNDGSDGRPAVIRTTGVDDLFDAIDPTNAIRSFGAGAIPLSAQDNDLPLEIMTEYTLAPGASAVRIETTIKNNGDRALLLFGGDFANGSGELNTFVPSLGWGESAVRLEMPLLAYTGFGKAAGLSYGIIPVPLQPGGFTAGAFAQSGLTVYLVGQDVLATLLGGAPGVIRVPPAGTGTYARYFAVGNGDVDSIVRVRDAIFNVTTGSVHGHVSAGGQAAAGALVAVVRKPGQVGARYDVVSSFRTDTDGNFDGELEPGNYFLMAKLNGYPYEGGGLEPVEHAVTITAGGDATQDFALPGAGTLRVNVTNASGAPIPARVTVVGHDPAPDPQNKQQVAILKLGGFVFQDVPREKEQVLFGITRVAFLGASGDSGPLTIPPGEYQVIVSRGPEYSAFSQRVTISAGEETAVAARLARVIDTTGFVTTDFHVHMINSPDSTVTKEERLLTMVAEGVESFAATDHDFLTDLSTLVSDLGLASFVRPIVSTESTTFNIGHFNTWPQRIDPTSITGGTIDWGRSGVAAGQDYPSAESYDLSPAELFAAARNKIDGDPDSGVIQANHINSSSLGYLHLTGTDTAMVPPQSFTDPTRIRQDPALTNLYSDGYTALEVWIEANRAQTELFLNANLGDWFNLLNQGRIKAGTADSDTHATTSVQAGGPRNFVALSTDQPGEVDPLELAASVNAGRLIGSNGPFVQVTLTGDEGAVAGLALDHPTIVPATSGTATLHIDVFSAAWVDFDTIEVFLNTVPVAVPDKNFNGATVPSYKAEPTTTLTAPADFTIDTVTVNADIPGASRHEAHVDVPLTVTRDSWVVVMVRGTDGVSRPLWPENPQDIAVEGNDTLDDLLDGNIGEDGNPAMAFTNPLFLDADGDGEFSAPLAGP